MQVKTLPAQRGWAWIVDGFALWRRNPALVTFLVMAYLFTQLVMSVVPHVGQIILALTAPALSLGIYNGCKAIAAGRKAGPDVLFSGFRQNLPELVKLGGINFIGMLLLMGLSVLIDPDMRDKIMDTMVGKTDAGELLSNDPSFVLALLVVTVGSTPLVMAYWFAPLLVSWGKVPAAKALFFSFIACLRNWRPFLVYSLCLMIVAQLISIVMVIAGLVTPVAAALVALGFAVVFLPVIYTSMYTNAIDVFGQITPDEQA